MFGFFAKAKVQSLTESLCATLASLDPQTMTEAGMLQLESQLDEVCKETAKSKMDYLKEQREADLIQTSYNEKLAAAEIIQTRMDAAPDQDKARLEISINKLLTDLEKMQIDVQREVDEAVQAKLLFEQMESTSQELATQFKDARKMFQDMQRQMQAAIATEKRANVMAERAKVLHGIQQGSGKLGSAMDAMKVATANAQANADAAQRKAILLTPTSVDSDDDVIAEALQQAKGVNSPATQTMAERLAALKQKTTS